MVVGRAHATILTRALRSRRAILPQARLCPKIATFERDFGQVRVLPKNGGLAYVELWNYGSEPIEVMPVAVYAKPH